MIRTYSRLETNHCLFRSLTQLFKNNIKADWKEKIWQGTIKVVERGDMTAVILENSDKKTIFAVCPIREGAVDRCVDSSRYFVLRIENATGRHMFVGVAFNERNDAFDFNTALEDSRRERATELAHQSAPSEVVPSKDYRLKEGEKIHIKISGTEDKKDPQFTTAAFANFHGNVTGSPDEISQNKEPNNGTCYIIYVLLLSMKEYLTTILCYESGKSVFLFITIC